MYYVVMDLEWNNSFVKSTQKFINEIIEIGAVKLDEDLNAVGTFSEIIKPVISRKLRSRIKILRILQTKKSVRESRLPRLWMPLSNGAETNVLL